MTTHIIKGFMYKSKFSDVPAFFSRDDQGDEYFALIGPVEFEYTIPADFNPVASEVASLEKMLGRINDEHMQQVKQIKGRIADLQCLPAPEPKASSTIDFSADEVTF